VADVVVGFLHLEKKDLDQIKALDASLSKDRPFDYFCWDLYTKVGLFYRDGNAGGEMNPGEDQTPERSTTCTRRRQQSYRRTRRLRRHAQRRMYSRYDGASRHSL
jgi:hypothetical protein